jgi:hypothetical protein
MFMREMGLMHLQILRLREKASAINEEVAGAETFVMLGPGESFV